MRLSRGVSVLAAGLTSAAVLAGCGLSTAGGYTPTATLAGPVADVERLDGLEIAVGSKNFTEQVLLGKMAVILMKSAGAEVTDFTNMPGSFTARNAMLQGDVAMEWEYTGTAWTSYLGNATGFPTRTKQYEAVREADLEQNGLVWLPPAPMENSYGFALTQEVARELDVSTISDLADLPVEQRTFCLESEFARRSDGFPPLLADYGFTVPADNRKIFDTGAVYAATADGQCNFGEIFTTDGRIKSLDLEVLADDRGYFPAYNVAPVLTEDVAEDYPQLADLFGPVSKKLTTRTMIELNARVDVDGEQPTDVALDWLTDEGFVE